MYPTSDDEYARRHDEAMANLDQWIDEPTPEEQELARLEQFHREVFSRTPLVFVTRAIVTANLAVFAVMVLSGVGLMSPTLDDLIGWGANTGPRTLAGQWWRLFTCTFIHAGAIHVAFNMWALWNVGRMVERLVGNFAFLVLYVVSGLAGSLASVAWNPSVTSVGASGAVFGVFGALLGFILAHRHAVPASIFQELRNSMLGVLGANLVLGMSIPGIDMAAHVGGLAAGFLCGLIISPPWHRTTTGRRLVRSLAVAALSALAIVATIHFLPPAPIDIREELRSFLATERETVDAYNAAAKKRNGKELTDEDFADLIEQEILPEWREGRRRLEEIGTVPKSQVENFSRLTQYARLREDEWTLTVAALRSHDPAKLREAKQKSQEVDALLKQGE